MFLLDQNLPIRLAKAPKAEFPGTVHVKEVGLATATDAAVWQHAKQGPWTVMSKDSDFRQMAFLHGPPPKFVWLRCGNASVSDLLAVVSGNHAQLKAFLKDREAAMLVVGTRRTTAMI